MKFFPYRPDEYTKYERFFDIYWSDSCMLVFLFSRRWSWLGSISVVVENKHEMESPFFSCIDNTSITLSARK